jgi:hypothetical protein
MLRSMYIYMCVCLCLCADTRVSHPSADQTLPIIAAIQYGAFSSPRVVELGTRSSKKPLLAPKEKKERPTLCMHAKPTLVRNAQFANGICL